MNRAPRALPATLSDHALACAEASVDMDRCVWLSDLRVRDSERLSDGSFAIMSIGMLVVTLAACVAACSALGGVL